MDRIAVSIASQSVQAEIIIRDYALSYKTMEATKSNQLVSITKTDGSTSQLESTQLAYSDIRDSDAWFQQSSSEQILQNSADQYNWQTLPVSIQGNGLSDLVLVRRDEDSGATWLKSYLAERSSDTLRRNEGKTCKLPIVPPSSTAQQISIILTDLSGSGRSDILIPFEDTTTSALSFAVVACDGTGFAMKEVLPQSNLDWHDESQFFALDVDETDRADVVEVLQEKSCVGFRTWLSGYGDPKDSLAPVSCTTTSDLWQD